MYAVRRTTHDERLILHTFSHEAIDKSICQVSPVCPRKVCLSFRVSTELWRLASHGKWLGPMALPPGNVDFRYKR